MLIFFTFADVTAFMLRILVFRAIAMCNGQLKTPIFRRSVALLCSRVCRLRANRVEFLPNRRSEDL
jgi:hypothetical protein